MENNINWNEELKNNLYEEVFRLYTKEKKNIYEIRNILKEKGIDEKEALNLAEQVEEEVEVKMKNKAITDIVIGLILIFTGSVFTYVSYTSAVERGGGIYFIKYGMVLAGIYSVVKGGILLSRIN